LMRAGQKSGRGETHRRRRTPSERRGPAKRYRRTGSGTWRCNRCFSLPNCQRPRKWLITPRHSRQLIPLIYDRKQHRPSSHNPHHPAKKSQADPAQSLSPPPRPNALDRLVGPRLKPPMAQPGRVFRGRKVSIGLGEKRFVRRSTPSGRRTTIKCSSTSRF